MKKYILASFVFLIINILNVHANQNVVLLKGKVLEFGTNNPLGTSFILRSATGKKITVKSNSIAGEYQQVVNPGEKYIVLFAEYTVSEADQELIVPAGKDYVEIEKDFYIKKIELGDILFKKNIFTYNDSAITDSGIEFLNELKDFLILQKKLNVDIEINVSDCYFTTKKISVPQEGKKKKKIIKLSPADQAQDMAVYRINNLKEKFSQIGIRLSGVNFIPKYDKLNQKGKKSKKKSNDLDNNDVTMKITVSGFKKL